jgi:TPR repeat protein
MNTADNTETDEIMCCAGCGVKEDDDIKLKKCTACYQVRYCGVKCQKEHWSKHKKECKKRAAELRDEILFKQPESSHLGDCPICFLPLSFDQSKSSLMPCCSKLLCKGCLYADAMREKGGRFEHKCPFCRHPSPKSEEEAIANYMKRAEANDPIAMLQMGIHHHKERDYIRAFDFLSKAAKLGNLDAHQHLGIMYCGGHGVEKDMKKSFFYFEKASIGGLAEARHNLAVIEGKNGRYDRAMKHFIIAANLGYDRSLEALKKAFEAGFATKEDYAKALRGHKAAVDALKSPQREAAEVYFRNM